MHDPRENWLVLRPAVILESAVNCDAAGSSGACAVN
jgi:hypothetical protein